ncbi:YggT family protein [Leucobacter sp. M11]|uniref:YggT family protein n=1 Tax=Leucobacter sp. M11 TaxID=2993565 RepID=UPI002D7E5089|nr:YggT family protein [Leucobacter sp. M11]MEB4616585.1 YggT family protein [Leucobacter sp. M11]
MGVVTVIKAVLYTLIGLYVAVLWVRFILDWVRVLNPSFRPKGAVAVLFEAVFVITDPPIRMFRKIVPPLRIGQVQLDLGWMLTMLCCWILQAFLR